MRSIKFSLIIMFSLISIISCSEKPQKQFTNPILAGFYPDPSFCRVGDDYYLVNSTFSYFPGIPIFHSKDLVNWELIGHVMDRPEQLNTEGLGVSRGIFAPAISYHDGLFYVTCTIVDGGGNFVVTSKNPEGPYSNPIFLSEINGIDPSLHFEENGKAYILFNSDAPNNEPLYEGHRTIRMFEFDITNLKVIGDEMILINGGSDLNKKPIWIEGPHIYHRYDYYYLMAAEGGTAEDHSEVIFKSKNIEGPYESYSGNPILTQRNLDPKRQNPITSTGHADLIETQNGEWWAVFLGCRPYKPFENNDYNLGRETFLAPVKWIEEPNSNNAMWPIINPDYKEVQYYYNYPDIDIKEQIQTTAYSGNFAVTYDFDKDGLDKNFIFLRTPKEKWYSLVEKESYLSVKTRPETCSGLLTPSFIGYRQHHNTCWASTKLQFSPASENEKSGLLVFMNENHYYLICKSLEKNKEVIQLYKSNDSENPNDEIELMASSIIPAEYKNSEVSLKINAAGKDFSFEYSYDDKNWNLLKDNVDGTFVRCDIPRDFVGSVFALYSTSNGKESNSVAHFNNFSYLGNDEVYNK
ncbi:MAG: glycoside hydrolase family 43 protein [Ignavibacteriae bacterium]|nr:glycoside hydrolase family 43 protein [Ignavibacteriota bacterium]